MNQIRDESSRLIRAPIPGGVSSKINPPAVETGTGTFDHSAGATINILSVKSGGHVRGDFGSRPPPGPTTTAQSRCRTMVLQRTTPPDLGPIRSSPDREPAARDGSPPLAVPLGRNSAQMFGASRKGRKLDERAGLTAGPNLSRFESQGGRERSARWEKKSSLRHGEPSLVHQRPVPRGFQHGKMSSGRSQYRSTVEPTPARGDRVTCFTVEPPPIMIKGTGGGMPIRRILQQVGNCHATGDNHTMVILFLFFFGLDWHSGLGR